MMMAMWRRILSIGVITTRPMTLIVVTTVNIGKYFACFCVISFVSVPYFSVDHFGTCSCFILLSTNRKRCSWELNGGGGGIRFGREL